MQTRRGSVVVVSHDDQNRTALRRIFSDSGWQIRERRAVSEFRQYLKPRWSGVILTECCLPDGTWKDILALANEVCPNAQIVVTSRLADEQLWAEVLNRGAFDLLAQPLEESEVIRVGTSAWMHCGGSKAEGANA
jgi:FixJ family two-component response regulator